MSLFPQVSYPLTLSEMDLYITIYPSNRLLFLGIFSLSPPLTFTYTTYLRTDASYTCMYIDGRPGREMRSSV